MANNDKEYFTFGGILENLNPDDDRDVIDIRYFKERLECYEIARRIDILTVDEIRKLERLPPYKRICDKT